MNSILYDAWASCGEGNWDRSRFYLSIKERHLSTRRGTRKWLIATDMDKIFGAEVAQEIRLRKLMDAELKQREVRPHPELPDRKDDG